MSLTYMPFLHNGQNTGGVPYYGVAITGWGDNRVLRFYGDGRITTPKGEVAFTSDVDGATNTRSSQGNTSDLGVGGWTIIQTKDSSTPSGFRYRITGTVRFDGEGAITVTYPMTLSGVFPSCYGCAPLLKGFWAWNDAYPMLCGIPGLDRLTIGGQNPSTDGEGWPVYGTWWVEGW